MCENEEAQICLLRQVYELWQYHPQFLIVVVDKMLKTQIVECCAVANWIFSRAMSSEFTRSFLWEILHLTIKKMNKHVIRLEKEVAEARLKLKAAPSDSESSDEDPTRGMHFFLNGLYFVYYLICECYWFKKKIEGASEKRKNPAKSKDGAKDTERPTEEMVEKMEERLEAAQADQKNLFLIVFQVRPVFCLPFGFTVSNVRMHLDWGSVLS